MSTLAVNTITTQTGDTVTLPTGKKIVGTDAGSIVAPGSVIQIAHGRLSNTVVATGVAGSDYIYEIGLSASITPKFSNSNILINVNMYVGCDQTNSSGYLQSYLIYKDGSQLTEVNGNQEGGRRGVAGGINMYDNGGATQTQYQIARLGGTHMDYNVGATTAQTYSIRTRSYSSGPTIYINRSQTFQIQSANYDHVPQSTITLTEIAQ